MPPLPALQVRVPNAANALLAAEQIQGARAQRNALARQARQQEQIAQAFEGRDITTPAGQQAIVGRVATVAPMRALEFQQAFNQLNAQDQARIQQEGQQISRALFGVTNQAAYDQARASLPENLADKLPAEFDPNFVRSRIQASRSIDSMVAAQKPVALGPGQSLVSPTGETIASIPAPPPSLPASSLPLTEERFQQNLALRRAGRPETNVTVERARQLYGTAPTGFSWVRDAEGNVLLEQATDAQGNLLVNADGSPTLAPRLVATPGGPAQAEAEEAAAQRAQRQEARELQANVVLREIQGARDIINDPNRTMPVVGLVGGQIASNIGGTPAFDLSQRLATVRANIGFNKLQEMRESSPTGGALGPVSDFENRLLQSVQGSLEQAQSEPALLQQLDNVEQSFNWVVNGTGSLPPGATEGVSTFDVPKPTTQAEFDILPRGAIYISPDDGNLYRKP